MPSDSLPTADDAWAAYVTVQAFWRALESGDDADALALTADDVHQQIGTDAGFTARLLETLAIDADTASRIGVSTKVRVVQGEMVLPSIEVRDPNTPMVVGSWGPVQMRAWLIRVAFGRGRWLVAGTYEQPAEGWPPGTQYVDIPQQLPPRGPLQ